MVSALCDYREFCEETLARLIEVTGRDLSLERGIGGSFCIRFDRGHAGNMFKLYLDRYFKQYQKGRLLDDVIYDIVKFMS